MASIAVWPAAVGAGNHTNRVRDTGRLAIDTRQPAALWGFLCLCLPAGMVTGRLARRRSKTPRMPDAAWLGAAATEESAG